MSKSTDQNKKRVRIEEIMSKGLVTLSADSTAFDAAKEMSAKVISSIITTDTDKTVGIVTERDLVKQVCAKDLLSSKTPLIAIMSSPLITIKASSSVSEAADMMLQYNVRHLLIIDDKDNADKPLGIITPVDFTRYQKHVADEDKEAIQKVLQKDMASEVGISSSSSVHFEDGLESS